MRELRKQLNREAHAQLQQIERDYVDIVPETIRATLADRLEAHAHEALDRAITLLQGEQTTYADAIRGMAISTDRMRLLREQSTSISATATSPEEKRAAILAFIEKRAIDAHIVESIDAHTHTHTREGAGALEKAGGGEEGSCSSSEGGECDTTPTRLEVT